MAGFGSMEHCLHGHRFETLDQVEEASGEFLDSKPKKWRFRAHPEYCRSFTEDPPLETVPLRWYSEQFKEGCMEEHGRFGGIT
ncbi:hypothetical protein KIN20_035473 [Parelaphostrongylus tenuis]|uniref:Uncharacterized protein n=1 Tax=Parelaphostrongylus tenuis TaxID=148309 RepID=A0AAD5RB76_PARTN|nr:hypothetical protein KIN20_035473 [Parelaphostrongylus tenuis]